jgi:hypothetical protein
MYMKCLVVLLPLVLACSQKEPVVTPFNEKLHINMEDLYNEVMEVDSVLINGELPIVCSLSSAIRIFGDTILTYFDYRFPFFDQPDGIDDPPLKIYVFKNALFSQWEENMLILVKLDFTDQIFITYKGAKIGGDSFIKSLGEFYNSYRVSMIDEYFRLGSGNAFTFFFKIRASNTVYDYHKAYWRFFVQSNKINSLELCTFRQ